MVARWGIQAAGHFGVLVFFIHTSLVLMMSLDRLLEKGTKVAARFYLRRLFRIYPLSIFTVVVITALRIPSYFDHFVEPGVAVLLANLFLVQNIFGKFSVTGPLWSLPFEVQMYLMLPLFHLGVRRMTSPVLAAMAALAGGFALWYTELRIDRLLHLPSLLEYAPWFGMGIAAYAISHRPRRGLGWPCYGAALTLFALTPFLANRPIASYRAGWAGWAAGIIFALVLPSFADIQWTPLKRAAQLIARYSYGVYLWHAPVLWFAFLKLAGQPWPVRIVICVILLTATPVALFHLIESPMINAGKRVADRC